MGDAMTTPERVVREALRRRGTCGEGRDMPRQDCGSIPPVDKLLLGPMAVLVGLHAKGVGIERLPMEQSAAQCQRFTPRGEEDFADKLLSARGYQCGGHLERKAGV